MFMSNRNLFDDLLSVVVETSKAAGEVIKPIVDAGVSTVKSTVETAESDINNQQALYNIGKTVYDTLNECTMYDLQPKDVDLEALAKLIKYIYVERYEQKIQSIKEEVKQ